MNKVEEVARAILKARFYDCEPEMYESEAAFYETVWPDFGEEAKYEAIDAIKAMREPTPQMVASTLPNIGMHCDPKTTTLAERALFFLEPKDFPVESHRSGLDGARLLIGYWRDMIDAALTDGGE